MHYAKILAKVLLKLYHILRYFNLKILRSQRQHHSSFYDIFKNSQETISEWQEILCRCWGDKVELGTTSTIFKCVKS